MHADMSILDTTRSPDIAGGIHISTRRHLDRQGQRRNRHPRGPLPDGVATRSLEANCCGGAELEERRSPDGRVAGGVDEVSISQAEEEYALSET